MRPGDVGTVLRVDRSKKPVLVAAPPPPGAPGAPGGSRTWWYAAAALVPVAPADAAGGEPAGAAAAALAADPPAAAAAAEWAADAEWAAADAARRGLDGVVRGWGVAERMAGGGRMPAWFGRALREEEARDAREAGWAWGLFDPACITLSAQASRARPSARRAPG
jgi:pimeloyl-ACP methyl ester carboxylesterase